LQEIRAESILAGRKPFTQSCAGVQATRANLIPRKESDAMKTKILVLTALLVASGSALAQTQLNTITVRPEPGATGGVMTFDCNALAEPTVEDTQGLLTINDKTQVRQLRMALMQAVSDACTNGTTTLVVERGQNGRSLQVHAVQ
jgi:hypothetical protein